MQQPTLRFHKQDQVLKLLEATARVSSHPWGAWPRVEGAATPAAPQGGTLRAFLQPDDRAGQRVCAGKGAVPACVRGCEVCDGRGRRMCQVRVRWLRQVCEVPSGCAVGGRRPQLGPRSPLRLWSLRRARRAGRSPLKACGEEPAAQGSPTCSGPQDVSLGPIRRHLCHLGGSGQQGRGARHAKFAKRVEGYRGWNLPHLPD